jgi:hypothetical protein
VSLASMTTWGLNSSGTMKPCSPPLRPAEPPRLLCWQGWSQRPPSTSCPGDWRQGHFGAHGPLYAFDTRANTLVPELVDNPSAGREHSFSAFRLKGAGGEEVAVRPLAECSEARAWDELDAR